MWRRTWPATELAVSADNDVIEAISIDVPSTGHNALTVDFLSAFTAAERLVR